VLTETTIRKLKRHAARYTTTDTAGLCLEVMPTGLKVWRYRYRSERLGESRVTIGRWPAVSLAQARVRRAQLAEWVAKGENPTTAVREEEHMKNSGQTVREFGAHYIKEVLQRDRKHPKELQSMLERLVWPEIGNRIMSQVTGAELREIVFKKRDADRPAAAAALRNLLKRMWDYAIVCGAATANPAHATPLKFIARSRTRSRTLSRAEVGQFLSTLYTSRISRAHKLALHLILLTLCRKSEMRLAEWGEFDFKESIWEIPSDHSKTGKPHIVYLSRQALAIVTELHDSAGPLQTFLLPAESSFTQPMSASTLNAAMTRIKWGIPHFTIHDLRRTAATLLSEAGYAPDVIEKALNHTIKGVRGVYNRAEYADQRREMLQAWADMVDDWRIV
jgi:integrase